MASRFVVLFSRAPDREARSKGLAARAGEELFAAFAAGWADAARAAGARLVVASAPGDRAAWRRLFGGALPDFVQQRGRSFGERLESSARQVAAFGGRALVVGGDVVPSAGDLARGFELLDAGADAVIAPAADGGVSLVGLSTDDLDLLGGMAPRRRDEFSRLRETLEFRGRRVEIVAVVPDVDGRAALADLTRCETLRPYAGLLRRACAPPSGPELSLRSLPARPPASPAALRGPPLS